MALVGGAQDASRKDDLRPERSFMPIAGMKDDLRLLDLLDARELREAALAARFDLPPVLPTLRTNVSLDY